MVVVAVVVQILQSHKVNLNEPEPSWRCCCCVAQHAWEWHGKSVLNVARRKEEKKEGA